jgi:hypothetical protein
MLFGHSFSVENLEKLPFQVGEKNDGMENSEWHSMGLWLRLLGFFQCGFCLRFGTMAKHWKSNFWPVRTPETVHHVS